MALARRAVHETIVDEVVCVDSMRSSRTPGTGAVFALRPKPDSSLPALIDVEVVARAVRGAVLRHAADARDPILSGHRLDGAPLDRAHLTVMPLPVRGEGREVPAIGGVVVVVPADGEGERIALAGALAAWARAGMRLLLGRLGAFRLEGGRASRDDRVFEALFGASRSWVTITPIALDRNPGNLLHADAGRAREARMCAEATVAAACEAVGLPRPVEVAIGREAFAAGIPAAPRFMPFPRDPVKTRRVCVHARVDFSGEVAGPVVLGAGRYFGVGVLGSPFPESWTGTLVTKSRSLSMLS